MRWRDRRARARARTALAAARRRWLSPQRLLIACLVAVVAAAALVVYLERRAAALQRVRTDMVLRQVCERTAAALATRTRELFGAAVLGTIESIGHREIERYNLARVDRALAAGTRQHAYVDRFFFGTNAWRRASASSCSSTVRPARPARWTSRPARGAASTRIRPPARRCGSSGNACGARRSFRRCGRRARRGAAPGRLPLHVGQPGADRGLRHHRLRRRSRQSADAALRPDRRRQPRAAARPWRRPAAAGAARRGCRRTPHHRRRPRRDEPAVRVGARRPAVLPQPRARQLPGAAAAGGQLAADRPARSAAP